MASRRSERSIPKISSYQVHTHLLSSSSSQSDESDTCSEDSDYFPSAEKGYFHKYRANRSSRKPQQQPNKPSPVLDIPLTTTTPSLHGDCTPGPTSQPPPQQEPIATDPKRALDEDPVRTPVRRKRRRKAPSARRKPQATKAGSTPKIRLLPNRNRKHPPHFSMDTNNILTCSHCGAWLFCTELRNPPCCIGGKLREQLLLRYPLQPLPQLFSHTLQDHTLNLHRQSRDFNNRLSLVCNTFPASIDRRPYPRGRMALTIQGKKFCRLLPGNYHPPLQYFAVGPQAEESPNFTGLTEQFASWLTEHNHLYNEVRRLQDTEADDAVLELDYDTSNQRGYSALIRHPSSAVTRPRCLMIFKHSPALWEESGVFLKSTDRLYEPLAYPMLFPHGEHGWCLQIEPISPPASGDTTSTGTTTQVANLSVAHYAKARLLIPEVTRIVDGNSSSYGGLTLGNDVDDELGFSLHDMTYTSKLGLELPCNRFQYNAWLGMGEYALDMYCRIEDVRLAFIQTPKFQKRLRKSVIDFNEVANTDEFDEDLCVSIANANQPVDDDRLAQSVYLPSSVVGSPRHLKVLASNAFALVRSFGRPWMFITLTCNIYWTEIEQALPEGLTAFDRPDVVTRVFKGKLDSLIERLQNGSAWGPHTYDRTHKHYKYRVGQHGYLLFVIEYQHRGLPHAHIVVKPEHGSQGEISHPQPGDPAYWIDHLVCARKPSYSVLRDFGMISAIPNETPDISTGSGFQVDPHVTKWYGISTPQALLQRLTRIVLGSYTGDDFGRGTMEHKHPHNDWRPNKWCENRDGRCRAHYPKPVKPSSVYGPDGWVDYRRTAHDVFIVPYNPWISLDVSTEQHGTHCNVEKCATVYAVAYLFKYLFKGTDLSKFYLRTTSGEAVNEVEEWLSARHISSMEAMWKILQFTSYYSNPPVKVIKVNWGALKPDTASGCSALLLYLCRPTDLDAELYNFCILPFWETLEVSVNKPSHRTNWSADVAGRTYYYYRRASRRCARLQAVPIMSGEIFYMRLLLMHIPSYHPSASDLKVISGIEYPSFESAALALGIVSDTVLYEAEMASLQAITVGCDGDQLRSLFLILTLNGYSTHHLLQHDTVGPAMRTDLVDEQSFACSLRTVFEAMGSSPSTYGFGQSRNDDDVTVEQIVAEEAAKFPTAALATFVSNPDHALTYDQLEVLNAVVMGIDNPTNSLTKFFLSGAAGTGKTHTINFILATLRQQGHVCLTCALSAMAASLFQHGSTAHSLFRLPIDTSDNSEPSTVRLTKPREILRISTASFIVIDEISSLHRRHFEAILLFLRRLDWRGVLLVCGDFNQIPPVVTRRARAETIDASAVSSQQWVTFKQLTLTSQHRQRADPQYGNFLSNLARNDLAVNKMTDDGDPIVPLDLIPTVFHSGCEDEALQWLYSTSADTLTSMRSNIAILAGRNSCVDDWNARVQRRNNNVPFTLTGHTTVKAECEEFVADIPDDVVDDFDANGVPPNKLVLKVGDHCLITRNLDKHHLLLNNTRVKILDIRTHIITVQSLLNEQVHFIPRIRFTFKLGDSPLEIQRIQFPLRLAYAMTYNRSQGQTLHRALIDIRGPPFTHGHLYVALSRVRSRQDLALFAENANAVESPNITFRSLLSSG